MPHDSYSASAILCSDECYQATKTSAMAIRDENNPSLYRLLDAPNVPDPYYTEDYTTNHRGKGSVIVIDNGSYQCRAGWAGEDGPQLVFRNAIARTRGKKGESDTTVVGNDITNMEAVRSTLRTQFDRSLVSNFSYQEQIFDYCFSHLGLSAEKKVNHPVLVTEPLCNPGYCRSHMTELLFEGYGVPAVAYGVDALFSAHHNLGEVRDGVIVSAGHQTVHLLPVVEGSPDFSHCKRVNVGGLHTVSYLHRLLQLKYPGLLPHITLTRAQEILSHHCTVSLDYPEDLRSWAAGKCVDQYRVIQLPYSQVSATTATDTASKEQRDQQRRQRAREQLLRVNQRKKEEKIAAYQIQLNKLTQLLESQSTFDPEEYQLMLEDDGFMSVEDLVRAVGSVRASLEAEQEKLAGVVKSLACGGVRSEGVGSGGVEEVEVSEEWLGSLRERKKELLEQRRQRLQRKQDMSNRRSAASQQRMKIISLLGAEEKSKKGSKQNKEDTFGMDDDDWNVYRTISKDADESNDERDENELQEINKVLEKHDPSPGGSLCGPQGKPADVASYYQLALGVERMQAPEVLFQPSMVGIDQSGLSDCLEYVLQYYPAAVQQRLVETVFVTGGAAQFPNFDARVEADLRCNRPFQSHFRVLPAQDKVLDAWRGGASWSCDPRNKESFVSRREYMEMGVEYFKEHSASNIYLRTPL